MMKKIGIWRLLRVLLVIGISLCMAGASLSQGRGRGASVGRVELAFVEDVNVAAGTLVVSGETYRVDASTRILDSDGDQIGLEDLKLPDGVNLGSRIEMDVAGRGSGWRRVRSLRVFGDPIP
jgi:hypothetical protein